MNKIKKDWLNIQYNKLNLDIRKRSQFNEILNELSNQHHDLYFTQYIINNLRTYPYYGKDEIIKRIKSLENDFDTTQYCINNNIIELLNLLDKYKFNKEDCNLLCEFMNWDPIIKLTGEEDEWVNYSNDNNEIIQQNDFCNDVFRKNYDNSTAYWTNKKIFSNDGGHSWYTKKDYFVNIKFPFTVPDYSEKIYLDKDGNDITYNLQLIKKLYNETKEKYNK